MAEPGTYKIFQFNGKDCFLQDETNPDHFCVLSHQELTHEFRDLITVGRVVIITPDGKVNAMKTPAETEAEREKKQRQTQCYASIAAIEAMGEENLLPYQLEKLRLLRKEYEQYEPLDPTALTIELKRTNKAMGWE
jgi:hypothetical protein